MSQLTDRLERDLRQLADDAHPSPSAWQSIAARLGEDGHTEVVLEFEPTPARPKRGVWIAVVAAAVVAIIATIAVLTRAGDDQDSISTVGPDPTTFVSPRMGFSVEYPDGAIVTPATNLFGNPGPEELSPGQSPPVNDGVDVVETASGAIFTGGSLEHTLEFPLEHLASLDDYIDEYILGGGCGAPRRQQAEITIDGQPGRIAECPNEIVATVVGGRRTYRFTLLHGGRDARAEFDAFADTIRLTPETASEIPRLETTFVSPTYGYSFGYLDRGGLAPATERWEPGSGQFDDEPGIDDRFDGVETGLAAYLGAASTVIPEGVSIDEWVDEYVTSIPARGCGVPRSQQEEITIDGQPGRIAQCANRVEATVTAGGRLYLFILSHGARPDARAFFEAWIATIDLTPETAAVP